jgi:hypothetical protein
MDGLALCREYSQPPQWWMDLDRGTQALLLADWRERIRLQKAANPRRR